MSHWIKWYRDLHTAQSAVGKLYIEAEGEEREYFCETCEDTVRPDGIKVYMHTAVPADVVFNVEIRYSPKFKRDCVVLYTRKEQLEDGTVEYWIEHKGVVFGYIMFHGGNDHHDTYGCPLVAYYRRNKGEIYDSAEKELTSKVKELMKTCDVKAIAYNLNQAG